MGLKLKSQALKLLSITVMLLVLALGWGACKSTDITTRTKPPSEVGGRPKKSTGKPPKDNQAKKQQASLELRDLRVAVLKDHGVLVVPRGGYEYDLKPFLASLHGVAEAKVRMSQSKSDVEFDTGDCPDDATDTYELEYQVNAKDHTLDIECADSAEDLPEKVAKGLLALADDKIYLYELDDNDGDDDEVEINTGDMLFFLIDSDDLDKTKKLGKQAVRFEDEDEDTESEDVGAVLAFGGEDVAVKSTDDGSAASGDGYLFVAVHWGGGDDADEAFGLGEDEEDNITKPVYGNNNDDNNDDENNDGDDDDDNDNNNDDGSSDDNNGDTGNGDDSSDDGDNTPSEVCGEKAAPSNLDNDDACACTESGATKKGVVAAGKCTLSELACGQKPQTGTNGTSCTCKLAVADTTDAAGVIDSGMCVANNVCGTKTHVATDNAACTCQAAAGDTQEVAGLVASDVCYNKADVCGHKKMTGAENASCSCKATVVAVSDTSGVIRSNICYMSLLSQGPALTRETTPPVEICGQKASRGVDGAACNCKEASDDVGTIPGVIASNKCIVGACGTKAQTAANGTRCRCTNASNVVIAGTVQSNVCHSTTTLAAERARQAARLVCGRKAAQGSDGADCTCKATAGDTQEIPGLIASNVCYNKANVCGHKAARGTNGASCTCKDTVTATQDTSGTIRSNVCYGPSLARRVAAVETCGQKASRGTDGAACNCKEASDDVGIIPGVIASNKCIVGACGTKAQTAANGTRCRCTNTRNTVIAGTVQSNICHSTTTLAAERARQAARLVCGRKAAQGSNGADCTCKATAGDTQEVPGLVESNICHNRAPVCGYKTAPGVDGATCSCKMRADYVSTIPGVIASNKCIVEACGTKRERAKSGWHCRCTNTRNTVITGTVQYNICHSETTLAEEQDLVCGRKAAQGSNGADCTCKEAAGYRQEVPGLVESNRCYNKAGVCGYKVVGGTDGAACTCKEEADDDTRYEAPGLVQLSVCYNRSKGCYYGLMPAADGAPCSCKRSHYSKSYSAGITKNNKCIPHDTCSVKDDGDRKEGAWCKCKLRSSSRNVLGIIKNNKCVANYLCGTKIRVARDGERCRCELTANLASVISPGFLTYDGITKNNKCVYNHVCGQKIQQGENGEACKCSLTEETSPVAGRIMSNRCLASEICNEKYQFKGTEGGACACKESWKDSGNIEGYLRLTPRESRTPWCYQYPSAITKFCKPRFTCHVHPCDNAVPDGIDGSACRCMYRGRIVDGRIITPYRTKICARGH